MRISHSLYNQLLNKKKAPRTVHVPFILPPIAHQYTYHMELIPGHHEKHTSPNESKSGTNIANVLTKEINEGEASQ